MLSEKVVLTLSGGMDSSVLLFMAAKKFKEIHTISFDYGQRHKRELNCISLQINDVIAKHGAKVTNKIIDVKYIKDISPVSSLTNNNIDNPNIKEMAGDAQPISYVPFRNNMFVSIAASYAESLGSNEIWYGSAEADSLAGYWDSSPEWLDSMNNILSLNRKTKIKLVAPLINKSKMQIIKDGVELKVNFANTWTCYSDRADGLADANTPSSSLRLRGFLDAGYIDPIEYVQQDKILVLYKKFNCFSIT